MEIKYYEISNGRDDCETLTEQTSEGAVKTALEWSRMEPEETITIKAIIITNVPMMRVRKGKVI